MDLVAFCQEDARIAATAAIFASQHAPRLGLASVELVRAQPVALARELGRATSPNENAVEALLSCPFYLYSEADTDNDSRFTQIAQLLEEIVNLCPQTVERTQQLLDRLVEGLPNNHARVLWRLQVKLRAFR